MVLASLLANRTQLLRIHSPEQVHSFRGAVVRLLPLESYLPLAERLQAC